MEGRRLGPYRVIGDLGQGGMGTVHLAEVVDEVHGLPIDARVALKVIHPHLLQTSRFLERFLREARIGRVVDHANVVRCFDCDVAAAEEGPCHFLVMEYVEGQTLRALVEELGVVPEELVRHIGCEIAQGLEAIHAAGVVHRDLKPENVLLTQDHVVKVMDLGVARLLDEAIRLSQTGTFVGSLEYAAPEQLDTQGREPDERADLHALGVVLYELATGRHPFRGDDVRRVLHGVLHETPRRAGEVNPQISPFMEEVIHTLVAKERDQRFPSARDLLEVLERGETSTWWETRATALRRKRRRPLRRVHVPRESAVYGREEEIAHLRRLYENARDGRGRVLLLEGEAGVGKTRLVDEFVGRLGEEGEGANVLVGSYPPGGAATAAGALSIALREHFGSERLEETLAPYLTATPRLLPSFAALLRGDLPPSEAPALTPGSLATVSVHVMQALARERPTILVLEDLHFAPAEGRAIFDALALAAVDHPILLVGTMRPGLPEGWAAQLEASAHVTRLGLARLGPRDLVQLLADVFHSESLAAELSGRIALKSDGNPFFVFEIIRGMREEGALRQRSDGAWDTTEILREIPVPSSVTDLVNARISDLGREDRELLEVAACCGFTFDPVLVAEAAGSERIPALKRLAHIERHHRLVRSAGASMVFDHHQIQDALYGGIMEALREEYHGAIAERLACRGRERGDGARAPVGEAALEICEHYLLGARGAEARPVLTPALDHAKRAYATERGGRLAGRALDLDDLLEGEDRVRVLLRLAGFLDMMGRREEQEKTLREALDLSERHGDAVLRSQAIQAWGWYRFALALFDEARAEIERAAELARLGGDIAEEAFAVGKLGAICQRLGRLDEMREHYVRWRELARQAGDVLGEACAIGGLGNHHHLQGRHEEARRHYEQYLRLAREAGDLYNEGVATGNLALVLRYLGHYGEALEHARRRLEIARENGDRRSEAVAYLNLGSTLLSLGDASASRRALEGGLRIQREIGARRELTLAGELMGAVAELEGDRDEALRLYEEGVAGYRALKDPGGTASSLLTLARLLRDLGRDEDARRCLEESLRLSRQQDAPPTYVMAACLLALLPGGDAEVAREAEAQYGDRLGLGDRMETSFRLWQIDGDPARLEEARGLLTYAIDHAPEAHRATIFSTVHREIEDAWPRSGSGG